MNGRADGPIWGDRWGLPDDDADAWHAQQQLDRRRSLEELQACYLEDLAKRRKLQALQDELDRLTREIPHE